MSAECSGKVTLTFDNGPTPEVTPGVLDVLEARGLSACFCVVGRQLARSGEHADVCRETLRRGHLLVNHSLTHKVPLGDDPSARHASAEILDMHALMDTQLGPWGERWFRPFGGGGLLGPHLLSEPACDVLARAGYSVLLWNCVPRDDHRLDRSDFQTVESMIIPRHTVPQQH